VGNDGVTAEFETDERQPEDLAAWRRWLEDDRERVLGPDHPDTVTTRRASLSKRTAPATSITIPGTTKRSAGSRSRPDP
jgi:hypothetical protein